MKKHLITDKMKQYLTTMILFLSFGTTWEASAQTPSKGQNYIMESTPRRAYSSLADLTGKPVDSVNRTIRYFDGLGRPLQTVQWQGSSGRKDIVLVNEYDNFGREGRKYLPYAEQSANNGAYKTTAKTNQAAYYGSSSWDAHVKKTAHPYAQTIFEQSPLSRTLEQGAPGTVWQPSTERTTATGRTVAMEYGFNEGAGSQAVKQWTISGSGATGTTNYASGKLNKTIVKDENWEGGNTGTVEQYTDYDGKMVLSRIWESESKKLETYYIYDNAGNLCYVVPPAVTSSSFTESSADFNNYIYAYRYDYRNRVAEKKLPGKGWEWIVYDQSDRLILSQDAQQRLFNQWSYSKYDLHSRVTESGLHTGSYANQAAAQTAADYHAETNGGIRWESRSGATYTNHTFPVAGLQPLVVNYYDDYTFAGSTLVPEQGITKSNKTKGLQTGMSTYQVDGTSPLMTISYYDDKARLIQSANQNHLGGTDYLTNTYSFVGELESNKREHKASPAGAVTTLLTKNEYDHVGRPVITKKKVNDQAEIIQSQLAYNEIGQLKEKKLHSENGGASFINTIDYAYNERDWMTKIGSPHFTEEIKYNDPTAGAIAQYNGNLSEQHWGHGTTSTPNSFIYSYDKLNRLTNGTSTGIAMSEVLTYDDMGNISTLQRDGGTTTSYAYIGNHLTALSGGLSGSYTYNANGSATLDRTGMTFAYNHLNLPQSASKAGVSVDYLYDAMGSKLRKIATTGSTTTQRDYIGGIEYSKVGSATSEIEMILTEEGYLENNGGTFAYHYNLTDHLGNVRATLQRTSATSGIIIQKDDYYPFGMRKNLQTSGKNNYLYNGKEIQGELGGQYDYGARFYDPEIGRWNVVDPLAEQMRRHSVYNYAFNNPIRFIDPDGMSPMSNNQKAIMSGLLAWASIGSTSDKSGSAEDEMEEDQDEPKPRPPALLNNKYIKPVVEFLSQRDRAGAEAALDAYEEYGIEGFTNVSIGNARREIAFDFAMGGYGPWRTGLRSGGG